MKFAREVKDNRKGTSKHIESKRKPKASVGILLSGAGDSVTKDVEKAVTVSSFWGSVLAGKVFPQVYHVSESASRVCMREAVPTVEEES